MTRKPVAHHMRIPNALLRIVRVSMQALKYAHMGAPSSQGVRRMTETEREILKAEIRLELCFKIPPFISSANEWASAIDA